MQKPSKWLVLAFLFNLLFSASCVTRTERVPYRPYAPYEDEGILEELQRELGWHTPRQGDPFYKRAARGLRETVSGWFSSEEESSTAMQEELEQSRRRFEQEQQDAFRRLQERQEQTE